MAGAVGHLSAEVLVSCDAEINNLNEVIKEYRDPNFVIENPREDAAECMEAMISFLGKNKDGK